MSIRDVMLHSWFLPESFCRAIGKAYSDQVDFICPQAFGRNTFSNDDVGAIVNTAHKKLCDSHDIDTFEWLKSRNFDPGRPNRILALRCIRLAKALKSSIWGTYCHRIPPLITPVIGQWEVLCAMWLSEPDWYMEHQEILTPIWPPAQGYLGTRDMLLIVKKLADTCELKTPLLAAHPEHIKRCFFIARKIFGIAAIDIGTWEGNSHEEWFDPGSVQKWTRSPSRWLWYEMLVRIHHRIHGWI